MKMFVVMLYEGVFLIGCFNTYYLEACNIINGEIFEAGLHLASLRNSTKNLLDVSSFEIIFLMNAKEVSQFLSSY